MDFVKMQGTGNDFVVIDGHETQRDWGRLAIAMCDRHYGIGADGVLVVGPSETADFRMRMFNPDGSEAEMCGNGIRCFAKYVIEEGLAPGGRTDLTIETLAGLHAVSGRMAGSKVASVRVGMGAPRFAPEEIPVADEGRQRVIDHPLAVGGQRFAVTCLSMGNPHAVAFLDGPVEDLPLERIGPQVEHHSFFPQRVNFEVVNVQDRRRLTARVWERGAGLTLACGSGACAIAVAARVKGLINGAVAIALPGGTLRVEWDGEGEVWLEGPAETVFKGVWPGEAG
ncbi:MAG: diaminopimelate epimerase [Dehalococcoidia bacterium]